LPRSIDLHCLHVIQGYYTYSFIRTSSIDLHCLHTLSQSNYTYDGKCLHTLPRSYLGVAVAEEEDGVRGRAVAAAEEEASVRGRAAAEEAGVRAR
jgi:hypothetical protein